MRRYAVGIFWAAASLWALWQGIRLAFLPVAAQTTVGPDGTEVVSNVAFDQGIFVLAAVCLLYIPLSIAAIKRQYSLFWFMTIIHLVLNFLTLPSVGTLFLPSSVLLLIAALLSVNINRNNTSKVARQKHRRT